MTLFPTSIVRWVTAVELKLLYALVIKAKVAPIMEMIHHMRDVIRQSGPITCTSLITRIANAVGALDGEDIEYIPTPRAIIDLAYMAQGHHLTHDKEKNEIHYIFPGFINRILLPNQGLYLYKCHIYTFELKTKEQARREKLEKRRPRGETGEGSSAYQAPAQPMYVPQGYHAGWSPAYAMPSA